MNSSPVLALAFAAVALSSGASSAAPVKYDIDPNHTYPSFTADHMGGLSNWRGKINTSSGSIMLDAAAETGTVDVKMEMKDIDFGHEKLNADARSGQIFDVERFPTATYTGKLVKFKSGAPTEVEGSLTLHGVTRPVNLKINQFLCKPNPATGKETCGADAVGTLKRDEFGVDYGKAYGFKQEVDLQIQVEAVKAD